MVNLRDIAGQPLARRALEIAAAGEHNLLFVGPPGASKTMLARALPGLLPDPSPDEIRETLAVYEAAGLPRAAGEERPFRAPHHTVSRAALVGGGKPPRPGEASLAHNGVLFLDELPEFPRGTLEALCRPLEDGHVGGFPARFILVAAANLCPCGYRGDPRRRCRCLGAGIERYRARLSGSLLDRIELRIYVGAVSAADLAAERQQVPERSAVVRERVVAAREMAEARRTATGQLADIRERDADELRELVHRLAAASGRTQRAAHRLIRVARTVADLDGADAVTIRHVAEAAVYAG